LPRPWTGVLVGGSRFPAVIGEEGAGRLAKTLSSKEGSALISTSPRTAPAEIEALARGLTGPHYLHRWSRGGENPHQAILALADRFVVTSDSISMLAEAWRSGKPVERFQLDRSPWGITWQAKSGLGGFLARHGILTPPRDPDLVKVPEAPISEREIIERIESLMSGPSSAP